MITHLFMIDIVINIEKCQSWLKTQTFRVYNPSLFFLYRALYSGSRPPDSPASPGASSTSSVSGSSQTLHETPRQQAATYGASYTVTTVTPNGDRQQVPPDAHGTPKWSGFVALDPEPRPSKPVGVTLKAHTASGTLYAIASGPSSPPSSPRTPETPIFGSTSQRPRRMVLNGQGDGYTRVDGAMQDSRYQGDGYGTVRVNIEPIMATPENMNQRDSSQETITASLEEKKDPVPFKETSLGAVITTVNTYKQKQSQEDITEASMSDTVDQIEKAFGFRTPDMIANGSGSLERSGSMRKKLGNRSPMGSLQDIQLTPRRAQSGESLNHNRSSEDEDSPGNILKRLAKEANRHQDRDMQRKSEGDLPQNFIKAKATTVVEASPNSVEVKTEMKRKSEYEARVTARNLLIERLENHRQALEGGNVGGIKIYHAKSRSTPVDGSIVNEEKLPRPRPTSQDDSAKVTVEREEGDGMKVSHHGRRKKSGEVYPSKVRTPDNSRSSAKPVMRSERKIRLSSSASAGLTGADGSQTVPRQRSSRRRHVAKPSASTAVDGKNSDSSEDETRLRRGYAMETSPMTAGKLQFTPEKNKKSSSLPREWETGASPHGSVTRDSRDTREHRSHRSHSHSHLKNARITKIKMSASEEPNDSIVDQTSRLLNAAKSVKYDQGSSLVIAEDVLHSLTRASDLLHHQSVVAREERERERKDKDKSLSRVKAPGKLAMFSEFYLLRIENRAAQRLSFDK